MKIKTLKDVDVAGKRILLRTDYNVSIDEKGNITDDSRIKISLPTIKYILSKKPKSLAIMSHFGRPDGKIVHSLKMDKIALRLSKLIRKNVKKLNDCVGIEVEKEVAKGGIFLLENLRFHPEEEKNDENFAKQLAKLGDIYVDDAFGASHRAHASVEAIARFLPSCAGLLLEREIKVLSSILESPKRPFLVILGGAKVSDKIGAIRNLSKKADKLLIGGAMMFTFLKAEGYEIGKSKCELDKIEIAKSLLNSKIVLPSDTVAADAFDKSAKSENVAVIKIPKAYFGLDIGKETIKHYKKEIKKAKTILWNGPMGVFEFSKFAKGTNEIARAIAASKAIKIAGGGETVAVISKLKLEKKFTQVSSGGGAMLEFLEGRELPAIAALKRNK